MHTALDGRLIAFAALRRDSVSRQNAQLAGRCEELDERFQAAVARCREHQRLLSEAVRLNEHEAARELKRLQSAALEELDAVVRHVRSGAPEPLLQPPAIPHAAGKGSPAAEGVRGGRGGAKQDAKQGGKVAPAPATAGRGRGGKAAASAPADPPAAASQGVLDAIARVRRKADERAQAATSIAAAARGRRARQAVHPVMAARRRACVLIATVVRGRLARQLVDRRRRSAAAAAAVLIAYLRATATMAKGLARLKGVARKMGVSAVTLQSAYRRAVAVQLVEIRRRARDVLVRWAVRRRKRTLATVARAHRIEARLAADIIRRFFESLGEMAFLRAQFSRIGWRLAYATSYIQARYRSYRQRQAFKRRLTEERSRVRAADTLRGSLREIREQRQLLRTLVVRARGYRAAAVALQAGARGMAGRRRARARRAAQAEVHRRTQEAAIELCAEISAEIIAEIAAAVWDEHELQRRAAVVLQAEGRAMLVRRRMATAAAAAVSAPAVDVTFRFRSAPMARNAAEFAAHLSRLLATQSVPPVRLRPTRLRIRPAGVSVSAITRGARARGSGGGSGGRSMDGRVTVTTDGDGDGGGDWSGETATEADAIALIARVLPGTAPSEVSAVDAAAALLRLSPVEMGLYLGATLLAPPTASLLVPTAAPDTARGVATIWDAHHAAGSAATDEAAALRRGDVSIPTAPMVAAERMLAFSDVGKADAEARRTHAAHTLLRYVRRLESALPSSEGDDDEDEGDGAMMMLMEGASPSTAPNTAPVGTAAVATRRRRQRRQRRQAAWSEEEGAITNAALLSSLSVLVPLIREALHALRYSSTSSPSCSPSPPAEVAESGWGALPWPPYTLAGAEVAPIRGFLSLQRPSSFEMRQSAGSLAGRHLRWISNRVEIRVPPAAPATFELDRVLEEGARGAVAHYATLAQPMVRAALRGVSAHLIVLGDSTASGSVALFGELALPRRSEGALAWAAGVTYGVAGAAHKCGLAGQIAAELLSEASRWHSGLMTTSSMGGAHEGEDGSGDGDRGEGEGSRAGHAGRGTWRLECSAFQVIGAGVVDLLQSPPDLVHSPPDLVQSHPISSHEDLSPAVRSSDHGGGRSRTGSPPPSPPLAPPHTSGSGARGGACGAAAPVLELRDWSAVAAGGTMFDSSAGASGGAGAGSGATFAWPVGLARVAVQSPFEVAEVLAMALSRRRRLPARAPPTPYGSSGGVPAPPLCAPVALVFDMTSTALDGDTTTAQLTLWDIPRPHTFAAPSGGASATSISSDSAVSSVASVSSVATSPLKPNGASRPHAGMHPSTTRQELAEAAALNTALAALRELLTSQQAVASAVMGAPAEQAARAARQAALSTTLTRLLWRAVAGDCLTTCLGLGSTSESSLDATLETTRLVACARQLRTRPRARRVRTSLSIEELALMLESSHDLAAAAVDEEVHAAAELQHLLPAGDQLTLPVIRLGYEPLLRELEELSRLGAGAALEGRVLRRLCAKLLADVTKLIKLPPEARVLPPPLPEVAAADVTALTTALKQQLAREKARTKVAEGELWTQQSELKAAVEALEEARRREASLAERQRLVEARAKAAEERASLEREAHDEAERARRMAEDRARREATEAKEPTMEDVRNLIVGAEREATRMRHEVELRVARERLDMCTLDEFLYTPLAVVGFGYGGRHGGRADGADHGGLDSAEMSAEVATGAPTSPPKPATAAASPKTAHSRLHSRFDHIDEAHTEVEALARRREHAARQDQLLEALVIKASLASSRAEASSWAEASLASSPAVKAASSAVGPVEPAWSAPRCVGVPVAHPPGVSVASTSPLRNRAMPQPMSPPHVNVPTTVSHSPLAYAAPLDGEQRHLRGRQSFAGRNR